MNQLEISDSPLPDRRSGWLAVGTGDCDKAGFLYRDPDLEGIKLVKLWYQDVTNVGSAAAQPTPELVVDGLTPSAHNATLFYGASCMAIAMQPGNDAYLEYRRSEAGIWSGKTIKVVDSGTVTGLTGRGGWQEANGTMVVIATANVDGTAMGIVGRLAIKAYSEWVFTSFALPAGYTELLALRHAPDGTAHAIYTKTQYPCDGSCDLDLYYGRMASGGAWLEETIQESKWGAPDDEFATDPSMVLDSRGEPVVAATFVKRVITGSIKSAELRMYGRDNGEWCHETVATEVDGYRGSDGTDMTGIAPFVTVDSMGRVHVVFQDMAQWHDSQSQANAVNGQIRYAVRSGKTWILSTLFEQEGEGTGTAQAPLNGMLPTQVAVSADGATVYSAGAEFEWDTDSIYNTSGKPMTFKAVAVKAAVQFP